MAPRRVAIPWLSLERFYTTCSIFDFAPLGGIGYCLELRSSRLAHASTSAPNVCLSEPSLFGNADLKASAGASRQWHSRQHPTPLAVRSSSTDGEYLRQLRPHPAPRALLAELVAAGVPAEGIVGLDLLAGRLAVAHARGEIRIGDKRTSRSIIGGEFVAEAIGETTVGNRKAVLPRITGQAWIYGREELRMDAGDPFPRGFALSDSWGSQVGELG